MADPQQQPEEPHLGPSEEELRHLSRKEKTRKCGHDFVNGILTARQNLRLYLAEFLANLLFGLLGLGSSAQGPMAGRIEWRNDEETLDRCT